MLRTFPFWYENVISNGHNVNEDVVTNALFSGDVSNLQRLRYRLHHSRELKRISRSFGAIRYFTSLNEPPFLLELIASSPRLKLVHVFAFQNYWMEIVETNQALPDHQVDLPYLQSLRLVVFDQVNLLYLFLKHVTFPPDLKWSIVSDHRNDFEESPPLLQLLSRAHFISLCLGFDGVIKSIFRAEHSSNELCFRCLTRTHLRTLWRPLMHVVQSSSHASCLPIFVGGVFDSTCKNFLVGMQSVKQLCGSDWSWLSCPMTLTPIPKKAMEYVARNMPDTNTVDMRQRPWTGILTLHWLRRWLCHRANYI